MIWVTGRGGLLGSEVREAFEKAKLDFVGSGREVDVADAGAVESFGRRGGFEWIVNCAAYTAVDKAEDEPEAVRGVNALGAGNLAAFAAAAGSRLVHISTDYVFAGDAARPYTETDPVDPRNVYGRTKAEGETLVREALPRHFILRTSWLYGSTGKSFVAAMLRLMNEKPKLTVVSDQRGTPTNAKGLAEFIAELVRGDSDRYGTYHYTDAGETTWFDFALEIYRLAAAKGLVRNACEIAPVTSAEYPAKAKRPAYSVLSKDLVRTVFGARLRDWRERLDEFLTEERERRFHE